MSKFKVGDKVVRTVESKAFWLIQGVKNYYIVTDIGAGGYWLQLDGVRDKEDSRPWYAPNFELYQEPEDEMPPAPKSVRYHHEAYRGLTSDSYLDVYSGRFAPGPRIRLRNKDNIGITIDADTALQLAHDLRRLAMDIKRKEKANV